MSTGERKKKEEAKGKKEISPHSSSSSSSSFPDNIVHGGRKRQSDQERDGCGLQHMHKTEGSDFFSTPNSRTSYKAKGGSDEIICLRPHSDNSC